MSLSSDGLLLCVASIVPCWRVFYLHLGHGFATLLSSNIHPELVPQWPQISGVSYLGDGSGVGSGVWSSSKYRP